MKTKILTIRMLIVYLLASTTVLHAQSAKSVKEYKQKVDSIIIILKKVYKLAEQQYNRTGNEEYVNILGQEVELIKLFKESSKNVKYLENFEEKVKSKKNTGLILFGTRDKNILKALKSIKWMTNTFILMKDIILVDGSLSNDNMVKNIPELKFPYNVKKLKRVYYWGYRNKLVKKIKE